MSRVTLWAAVLLAASPAWASIQIDEQLIDGNPGQDLFPEAAGAGTAFVSTRNGNNDVFFADETGASFPLAAGPGVQDQPAAHGD